MNSKFRQMHTPILFAVSVLVILLSIFSNTKDVWRTVFVSIAWISSFSLRKIFLSGSDSRKYFGLLTCLFELALVFALGFFAQDEGLRYLLLITSADCLISWGLGWGLPVYLLSLLLYAVPLISAREQLLRDALFRLFGDLPLFLFTGLISYLLFTILKNNERVEKALSEIALRDLELATAYEALEKANRSVEEVTVLKERNRIAREIHDTVGHTITNIIVETEAGNMLMPTDPEAAYGKYALAREQAAKALEEIRDSVRLFTRTEDELSLEEIVAGILHEARRHTDIAVKSDVELPDKIPGNLRQIIIRALKEGLSNGIRHGHANAFYFRLRTEDRKLIFLLQDNGSGCDDPHKGFGLIQMEKSVDEAGGSIRFSCEKDEGFEIRFTLPLKEALYEVN